MLQGFATTSAFVVESLSCCRTLVALGTQQRHRLDSTHESSGTPPGMPSCAPTPTRPPNLRLRLRLRPRPRRALNRPRPQSAGAEGNASSTLTSCLHCVITAPPQPHDHMTSPVTLSKTNGTPLLFKCLAAVCVLHSVGASSTRPLSTATSSAQPPATSGVPSPCLRRPRFASHVTREAHPQPSPLTLTLTAH